MEAALYTAYRDIIEGSSNISFYGFIDVNGEVYKELCEICSFTLLHSAAEGCCTAIINNMLLVSSLS